MDLAIQNPWWADPAAIEQDEKVREALRGGKVLYTFTLTRNTILLGPRQVGKTTLLKLYIRDLLKKGINPRNIFYFSCEPISTKEQLIAVLEEYDKLAQPFSGKKYLFLDEVTFVQDWERAIKYFIETLKTGILVATGSNASLPKTGTERLPGRDVQIDFFLPLSFRQFLLHFGSDQLRKALQKARLTTLEPAGTYRRILMIAPFRREIEGHLRVFFHTGGYVKAIYEFLGGRISESTYRGYVNWILGDLSKLDRRERIFQGVIRGVAAKYTSAFSLHAFAKDMEIPSPISVADYLDVLQSLLLLNTVYQIDLNKKIPLFRKERKAYFLDPLMYSVFQGYAKGVYQSYVDEDRLVEGIVCEALKRRFPNRQDADRFVFFYKKKQETDFVVKERELVGIEVKWRPGKKGDFHNAAAFRKKILLNTSTLDYENGFLLCPVGLFLAVV